MAEPPGNRHAIGLGCNRYVELSSKADPELAGSTGVLERDEVGSHHTGVS